MANYFDRFDGESPSGNYFDQFDEEVKKPVEVVQPADSGFLRQVADVPVGVARGAVMGVRMVADAFGANNPVSQSIKGVEGYLSGLLSAQAKQDEQEISRIMQEAEDKGVLEQVKAGFRAFATAPVDLLSQGLGTAAPAILATLGGKVLGAGALATRAIGAATGAGMGSGAVKGQIYEGVKEALAETGMSADQVEARAQLAQSYGGENLDMILTGAALGGLASATGIEPILARQAARSIVGRSIAGRAATTGVAEAAPEFAQGSQEQLAQNLALQREGFDVDTFRGVVGAGTLEGLAGAGLGAAVGALPSAGAAPEVAQPADPNLADIEPKVPVAPVAPAAPVAPVDSDVETEGQAAARRIAELEGDDFGPLTQPIRSPVPPSAAEVRAEPTLAPLDEEIEPAVLPTARVTPFEEKKMPARQASIEDEVILQNRDRSTEASIGQMQSIAAKPDYGRMGFSRDLANGAPVVFGGTVEPTRLGVQDVAIATDGRRIPTQYAVVEANEVLASNTVDGSTNEAYATSRDSTRAIAGNGRIAGIQAAYQRGNADTYKAELVADARLHGVDPAAIESMKAPVLVRFMPREFITRDIGDVSNISTGLELSAAEKAKNDLQRVDLDSVEFSDEGNITPTSVMEFIRAMPETERGGLIDNGKPSAQAFDRLRAAVFAKAYKNDELIRIYSQSEDAEVRSIFSALAKVAPKMSRLEGTGDFDIRGIVTSAAELALNARRSGVPIMRAAQQLDMTTDPDVYAMLEMFARNSRSAKNVARYLGDLADSFYAESSKPTEDFFGEVPKRSRAELLEQARIEDEQARQTEPLEEQTGRKPSQEDDVQARAEPRRKEPARQDQGEELELKPASPETFQAEKKRAAQEPADRERAQVKRESEAGADQFRLEGGEGRQDLTGKLFQKEDERGKKPSLAYHAGNLEYGRDTTLGRMMGGRSTGHFGTGVYFVSAPSKISGREDRPVQAVDLSQYNLAVMRSEFSARMLHDGLKAVNRMESADDLDTPEGQRAVRDLAFALKLPEDVIREAAIAAAAEAAPLKEIYAFENDYIDSASTRFMKRLGYDGVDTRGAEGFDTTEYGTVVYAQSLANQAEGDGIVGQLFQQDSGVVGDEIIVDGKVRPTKNSDGRLIENDPQKLRNFWRFFGESLVVDKDGRPLVMYHSTKSDFDVFDTTREATMGEGSFFGRRPNMKFAQGEGGNVMPVYLSIRNPKIFDNLFDYDGFDKKELIKDGHDGVFVKDNGKLLNAVAFRPEQIKSAIGNEGSYSNQSSKILESKETGKGWSPSPEAKAMEQELAGKSVDEMGQWIVDNAPNQFTKVIAQKVQARIREMQRRGVDMSIKVWTGSQRPNNLYSARGELAYRFTKDKPGEMLLSLNGVPVFENQAGYPPGMDYETVLHEMLHMATVAQTAGLSPTHPLIRELNDIRNKVVDEFNKRAKAGNLSDFEDRIYNRTINALANTDEILAWGLTDTDMQKFMASIKVGEKTLFDKFVEFMRKTLGLDVNYESAMDRLVKTSDHLLDMSIDEIEGGILQKGYMFGPAQPRLQPGDTMQGELFSAQQPPSKPPAGKKRLNVFNQTPLTQWTKPDETKMADFIYTMQDKLVDTKDVIKAIEDQNGKIEEQWNPYLQEELYHGRTAKQTGDFLSNEMRPLVKMMDRMGVTIDELDTYLHNRIAEQRNEQAAALNPALQDGGSGIMTADARAYLAGLTKDQKAKYEQLAKRVDEISQGTRNLLRDTGLESKETIDAWEKSNPNYVPLFREDVDYGVTKEVTTGLGFNTKGGTSKRFMGSQRNVVNILANIAMQRERAIVRSNKNRVALATYGLAVKNPNPGFWLAVNPDAKNIDKVIKELMAMGLSAADAKGVMQEPVQARVKREKNPKTGLMEEQIVYEVNPAARGKFDVFATRVDGKDRYVFFNGNDPRAARMVTALKNLDADSLGRAMGMAATITRYFAAINTQYNPVFGAFNFLRDMQGAAIQVSNTPLAGKRAEILAGAFPALKGIYTSLRADTKGKTAPMGQWAKLWDEFQQEGGQTGFRDQFSRSDERAEALQSELNQIREGKAKKAGRAIFNWLSDYNDAMENALRLSAYKAGLDKGLSKQEAASVAKNLTVNFNRKGQIGVQANALYAFFNAAVQGTARLIQTMGRMENGKFRLTKAGKTILGGGFLLGSLQAVALAAFGFDEDEPPQFIRERNFIIPTGDGKYITFPMPLGYNVIPNTSRIITEFVLSGGKDPAKRVADMTSAFLDMFNPIGNAGWSAQTIAPTIADPLVALTENKDWTGKPIAREDFSNLDPTPGYTRAKETASWFSKNLSEFMNFASGGTKYQPGVFSPTPDQIDYLIGTATGGVGRELLKLEQTVTGAVTGEEVPTFKIPLAGRFFGDSKAAASEANKFYTNLKELNQHENEIKGRRENKGDAAGYIRDNPEARLVTTANRIERNVQALRKKRRELVEKGAPKEAVKQIETQITVQMKRLNDMVTKLEK
jgi:CHASE3 domain sensor protein